MSKERLDNPRIFIPESQLQLRVQELAAEIEEWYKEKDLIVICVLQGAFIFFADLIRRIKLPLQCEFAQVVVSRLQKNTAPEIRLSLDVTGNLTKKHVLIIDDIIETGSTLYFLMQTIRARSPASIRVCSLLVKPHSLTRPVQADLYGFQIGEEYVVGYGMDFNEKFRSLPYIGVVEHTL